MQDKKNRGQSKKSSRKLLSKRERGGVGPLSESLHEKGGWRRRSMGERSATRKTPRRTWGNWEALGIKKTVPGGKGYRITAIGKCGGGY